MKKLLVVASLLVSFASAQPMELPFQHSMNGPLGEAVTTLVEKYNSSQDEVVIREVFASTYSKGLQKILAQLAAGDSPNIVQLEVSLIVRVAESGQLLDLAPRLEGEYSALYEDLWPVFREQIEREDGAIYALPFNNSNPVLYYNPELLKKAGVKPPRIYAEFPETARRIKEATGAYAVAFEPYPWVLEGTVWSNGGEVIGDGKLALNQPNAAEAIQTWTEVIREGTATVACSADTTTQNFAAGKIAMVFGSVAGYFFNEEAGTSTSALPRCPTSTSRWCP